MFFNIMIYRACQDVLASTFQSDGDLFSFTSPSHFSETPLSVNLHPPLREFRAASELNQRRFEIKREPPLFSIRRGSLFEQRGIWLFLSSPTLTDKACQLLLRSGFGIQAKSGTRILVIGIELDKLLIIRFSRFKIILGHPIIIAEIGQGRL